MDIIIITMESEESRLEVVVMSFVVVLAIFAVSVVFPVFAIIFSLKCSRCAKACLSSSCGEAACAAVWTAQWRMPKYQSVHVVRFALKNGDAVGCVPRAGRVRDVCAALKMAFSRASNQCNRRRD